MKLDETNIQSAFGAAVKAIRLEKALSQEELASRSGLHRTYLTDVERGSRNISLKAIGQIASGLDVSLSELFTAVEQLGEGHE